MDDTMILTSRGRRPTDRQGLTPTPHLFLIMESRRPLDLSARYRLDDIDEVIIGRGPGRSVERRKEGDRDQLVIRVQDPWMSSAHARIDRSGSSFTFADTESTNGSVLNGKPATEALLEDGDIIELGQTFFLFRAALPVSKLERDDVDARDIRAPKGLVSLLPSLAKQFADLADIVKTETPVVLFGQSGTGKEVMARAAHGLSGRKGAFVAVNCGALPDTLVESEFFGHKKGSFSGANEDRQGLVLAANRGTLFLDEIGDLPLSSQAALLRVLQEREVTPVGATSPTPVDFRLISATHRNMEELVEQGKFREDLLARLSGFLVELPPLGERKEDLGVLIGVLLSDLRDESDVEVTFSNEATQALIAYHWPRNVRELRTCLQTALALSKDGNIGLAHLNPPVRRALQRPEPATQEPKGQNALPKLSEEQAQRRERLIELLKEHNGNISAVARAMGKVRSQVQRWLKRYALDADSYRND